MNIRMFYRSTLAAISLLAGAALVQAEEPEICAPFMDSTVDESLLETMLSAAQQGHLYRIERSSSRVGFCVDSKLQRIEGTFRDFHGGMALDSGNAADGQTLVLIRTASLDTDAILVRNLIKGEQFFDVEHYPEVLFVSHGFHWTGNDTAVLSGDLTLRGITRPVSFSVKLTALDGKPVGTAQKILVKATTTIDRAEFGMTGLSALVNSQVQLCMSVEAQRYSG